MRRGLAWLVATPLMLAGSEAAHVLAYRFVYPQAHVRVLALATSGHGYLSRVPLVLGAAVAIALVSLLVASFDAARGRTVRALPAAAFALLPPLAFVVQEVLELSLHTGTFGWHAVLAPTFLPGIALQAPFAVAAYVAARLLLRAAERLGRLFALRHRPAFVELVFTPAAAPARSRLSSHRFASRGPPLAAAV
ncbi:MAG TPA: hypothetical protein VFM96_03850 [Gaiellaceae bacterium]|nr:hypothetical protein [Gaiellaceae bacterium]